MGKYSWSFKRENEIWNNDTHDTIEACITAAREENRINGGRYTKVHIGENEAFAPSVDATSMLESLEEDACQFCGEVADGWDACDLRKQDELDELSMALTTVVVGWLEKYGYSPSMWQVRSVGEYSWIEEG